MPSLKHETQEALQDLRYRVQQMGRALEAAAFATYHGSPGAINGIDIVIDQWNAIINRAPKVLKDAKLELLKEKP